MVSAIQFSVPGDELEYFVIHGPTPREIVERYAALTGRPALPPRWSFGLWLSTSFLTEYDEETVTHFVDGMQEREIPLSVIHFDCYWMKPLQWCDFEWDRDAFPDPEGMLQRLGDKGLRRSVWINPYLGQRSPLFLEAAEAGYLLRRPDGSVWQSDLWVAGMAMVDFTNPAAREWFAGKVRTLLDSGVDAIKTDFGERVPVDVVWHDGSDPALMHNYYTFLYNQTVFDEVGPGTRGGRGGAVRQVGHRRRPAVPRALGRGLRVELPVDGRVAARRALARSGRLRVLEPRHRRVRGHARSRPLQAVDRLRAAVLPLQAARVGVLPGALGLRRGGGRRHPASSPS